MKKLVLVFVAIFAMSLVSCNSKSKSPKSVADSTIVKPAPVDSTQLDSVPADSAEF